MKREILFRGKRIDTGEWVEGDLVKGFDSKMKISVHCDFDGMEYFITNQVNPDTIGQFTGRFDMTNKRIFEGDKIEEGIVFFSHVYFGFFVKGEFTEGENHPLYDLPPVKVIGNIHDNPELI